MTTTPFHDLSDFAAIPRVTALRPSPDGSWLALSVQTLDADRKKYVTSIWRVDVRQPAAPRRLTRSAEGEGSPRFLPDGSLRMYEENSPHLHAGKITTPMLVIHGNRDYRVPLSEALRLWWDLNLHQVPAKFLYFPDENHWILTPGNAAVWYETVFAFLAEHVLGEPWRRPSGGHGRRVCSSTSRRVA